jgi:hypothetical protein
MLSRGVIQEGCFCCPTRQHLQEETEKAVQAESTSHKSLEIEGEYL